MSMRGADVYPARAIWRGVTMGSSAVLTAARLLAKVNPGCTMPISHLLGDRPQQRVRAVGLPGTDGKSLREALLPAEPKSRAHRGEETVLTHYDANAPHDPESSAEAFAPTRRSRPMPFGMLTDKMTGTVARGKQRVAATLDSALSKAETLRARSKPSADPNALLLTLRDQLDGLEVSPLEITKEHGELWATVEFIYSPALEDAVMDALDRTADAHMLEELLYLNAIYADAA